MKVEQKMAQLSQVAVHLEQEKHNGIYRDNYLGWYQYQQLDQKIELAKAGVAVLGEMRHFDAFYETIHAEFPTLNPQADIHRWALIYQMHKFYEMVETAEQQLDELQKQYKIVKEVVKTFRS